MTEQTRAAITTHILDLDSGFPAVGLEVNLLSPDGKLKLLATSDSNGRIEQWSQEFALQSGQWQLIFLVEHWFKSKNKSSFFNDIHIAFRAELGQGHYHVPLLLNAYGYSTYRGS
ncbi:MAG: hydroxyisourate hydrolase [Cellvibrionaceae bacterium]|nr:hydroxyisourate hydrolase [Cellvibrionaceae bacterium]